MKLTVNQYLLDVFLRPIAGLADDDEAVNTYSYLNDGEENDYKRFIEIQIIPAYLKLNMKLKEKVKTTLSYYLSKEEFDFNRIFEACLPPFEPPKNARNFFLWIWEALFYTENYFLDDVEQFKEVNDINEPNMLSMHKDIKCEKPYP